MLMLAIVFFRTPNLSFDTVHFLFIRWPILLGGISTGICLTYIASNHINHLLSIELSIFMSTAMLVGLIVAARYEYPNVGNLSLVCGSTGCIVLVIERTIRKGHL
jgi:hypothetical protein